MADQNQPHQQHLMPHQQQQAYAQQVQQQQAYQHAQAQQAAQPQQVQQFQAQAPAPFPHMQQAPQMHYQQHQTQHVQQQRHQLQSFWNDQMREVQGINDFKNHQLPLARIKKIMKSDEEVRMISAEAPVLFAKACEMFILELTHRSWIHSEENKRRTLQRNDIAAAITKTDIFDFLVDIVPRDDIKEEGLPRPAAPGAPGAPTPTAPPTELPPAQQQQPVVSYTGAPAAMPGVPGQAPAQPQAYMPQHPGVRPDQHPQGMVMQHPAMMPPHPGMPQQVMYMQPQVPVQMQQPVPGQAQPMPPQM
mmetsp:Transcript_22313/g.26842  ORF Transcript_22313/g.26842 Transcript_22313/m.26842 type:complete len:304 (+) Transcript_22313:196-1107(+)|eukprot:CAMPEP_0197851512 /NCGR_PEP_ID=MMETSP1438-20131217/18255_1 /TAXON_ID=1461541 /ORGANISM="Pterosperma sp., Strain CCMP1384" /LENGTH=303 /DNA_ID=CAMNT_0043465131 /DNA_START=160 /DNA_END=1071 /DNA_ORIENTATION=+